MRQKTVGKIDTARGKAPRACEAIFSIFRTTVIATVLLATATACGEEGPLNEAQLKRFTEAQTLYRNKKFDEALTRLRQLREERPDALEAASLEARILFFTKQFVDSERVLKEVLDRDPNNPHALMWLGKTIAVDSERQAEAADHFRAIIERDPENYMARYYLGRCLEAQNQIRPALLEYQAALAMEYQISKIHLHMGRLLTGINMGDRAEKHFARVRVLGVSTGDIELAARAQATPDADDEAKAGGPPGR
ncbi:MAG: tetratricopeptide repeat protein [Leptospirales bacterium]|jgi:predicted Zn-dependent protease